MFRKTTPPLSIMPNADGSFVPSFCIFGLDHLDVQCIDALARALNGWGGNDGAIVVISHDRPFCEEIGFTHVGTVTNGRLVLEQRTVQDSDWEHYDIGAANNSKLRSEQ
jgi:hypothetical protein